MAYHYRESGLDNVFLEDGFKFHKTKYGKGVSIENTEELHRVIGRWLIELPKPLTGAELRFLRLEMELSQKGLAAIIGSAEQNVRRWELARKRPIPGLADRLVRALYSEYSGGGAKLTERQVIEIRARAANLPRSSGGYRLKKGALDPLATEYGVTVACLRQIIFGQRWAHL